MLLFYEIHSRTQHCAGTEALINSKALTATGVSTW